VDSLDRVLDSKSGLIATRQDGIQRSIDDITDQIERKEARVLASEERLRAQFNALELLLGEYQATGNYLTQQLEGLANLKQIHRREIGPQTEGPGRFTHCHPRNRFDDTMLPGLPQVGDHQRRNQGTASLDAL
jgi:hypothetical protein